MNKFEVVNGLYRQNVYNVSTPESRYGHFTCYFNHDFSFFLVVKAGENGNMTSFYKNENPEILSISDDLKNTLIEVLSTYTYSHIAPIKVGESSSLRKIFNDDFDKVIIDEWEKSDIRHIV